ncbi:MAG: hypothetical protein O3B41_02360 [Bacteroidetes bacterium]|nr:hypothetical protein [Bacteroidota bacterium]
MFGIMVFEAQGQVGPVSMLNSSAEQMHLGANPSPVALPSAGVRVHALTEIPFGLPELQTSWLSADWTGEVWQSGFRLSRSGFDQLTETGFGILVARKASGRAVLGLLNGVLLIQPGVLKRAYRPFWALGATIKLNESVWGTVSIQKEAESNQGLLSPSQLMVGGRVKIAPSAELASQIVLSDNHGLSLETVLSFQPVSRLSIELGYETNRSMLFGGLLATVIPFLASIHTSWHPVLGISTGVSVAWQNGERP